MTRKHYASDISREKFAQIEPLLRSVKRRTKPPKVDMYEVFCAVLYLLRTGCQWRFLPREFPPWATVYTYFRKWSKPDRRGVSVLEQALKKSGRPDQGARRPPRPHALPDRGRPECEEHGHGRAKRL